MIAYTFYETDNRVMRYAEALAARGDQVDVFSLGHEGQPEVEMLHGVRVFRIQKRVKNEKHKFSYLTRILTFLVRASFVVTAKHLRRRYDLVHVHSVPDFLIFAAIVPRLSGARVILDIHDLLPEFYAAKFKTKSSFMMIAMQAIERLSASLANHVIAPNHIWREKLVRRSVKPAKCTVFMNYPDPAIFSRQGRSRSDAKLILLYPGTLNRHQGLDLAVRAFAQNADRFPDSEFHIYGEGPTRDSLVELANELGLDSRVVVRKPLPLREIAKVIENADIGIIPKRNDGFGDEAFSTKSLEFMTLGVPIIIADTTVDKYYFNPEVVTFFRSGDVQDLSDRMFDLMNSQTLRDRQSEHATSFVEAYSWERKRNDYLGLVDRLVRAQRAPVVLFEP
jgi:glycosyltransferase involved in cell wall biosynthesis